MSVAVRRPQPAPPVIATPSSREGAVRSTSGLVLGLLLALALLALVALLSLAHGARPMGLGQAWAAFADFDPQSQDHLVVRSLRLPRTVLGLAVGAALGLAGAIMQGLTRNPLADPGIFGVNAGAAVGVVLAIHLLGIGSAVGWMGFAMAGAAGASLLVYALGSQGRGGATPVRLALAGAATTVGLHAVTMAVLLTDIETLDQFRFWQVGSLTGRELSLLTPIGPFLAVGAVMALASTRMLNALSLGEDVARSLGQHVGRVRALGALATVLLVGGAVSLAGPIGFVGLVIPHVARAITGPDHRWIMPYSAVLAPILLLGSDILGRLVARPGELPVGVVTAVVGAPFFVAIVRRRRLADL